MRTSASRAEPRARPAPVRPANGGNAPRKRVGTGPSISRSLPVNLDVLERLIGGPALAEQDLIEVSAFFPPGTEEASIKAQMGGPIGRALLAKVSGAVKPMEGLVQLGGVTAYRSPSGVGMQGNVQVAMPKGGAARVGRLPEVSGSRLDLGRVQLLPGKDSHTTTVLVRVSGLPTAATRWLVKGAPRALTPPAAKGFFDMSLVEAGWEPGSIIAAAPTERFGQWELAVAAKAGVLPQQWKAVPLKEGRPLPTVVLEAQRCSHHDQVPTIQHQLPSAKEVQQATLQLLAAAKAAAGAPRPPQPAPAAAASPAGATAAPGAGPSAPAANPGATTPAPDAATHPVATVPPASAATRSEAAAPGVTPAPTAVKPLATQQAGAGSSAAAAVAPADRGAEAQPQGQTAAGGQASGLGNVGGWPTLRPVQRPPIPQPQGAWAAPNRQQPQQQPQQAEGQRSTDKGAGRPQGPAQQQPPAAQSQQARQEPSGQRQQQQEGGPSGANAPLEGTQGSPFPLGASQEGGGRPQGTEAGSKQLTPTDLCSFSVPKPPAGVKSGWEDRLREAVYKVVSKKTGRPWSTWTEEEWQAGVEAEQGRRSRSTSRGREARAARSQSREPPHSQEDPNQEAGSYQVVHRGRGGGTRPTPRQQDTSKRQKLDTSNSTSHPSRACRGLGQAMQRAAGANSYAALADCDMEPGAPSTAGDAEMEPGEAGADPVDEIETGEVGTGAGPPADTSMSPGNP
jgi:hypothetical protein